MTEYVYGVTSIYRYIYKHIYIYICAVAEGKRLYYCIEIDDTMQTMSSVYLIC